LNEVRNNKEYAGKVYTRDNKNANNLNVTQQKKIENLTSNIFTKIETKTVIKRNKQNIEDNNKTLTKNNSFIGKKQYDLANFQTKENIFPNSHFATIAK